MTNRVGALTLALVACSTGPPSCPEAAPASVRAPASAAALPDLSWIEHARSVRIERGRSGLAGGYRARYELVRVDTAFEGFAVLTAGKPLPVDGGPPKLGSRAIALRIPVAILDGFLASLAESSLKKPDPPQAVQLSVTDDYPRSSIDIEDEDVCSSRGHCRPRRAVRFSSPATGSRPPPWFLWSDLAPVELDPVVVEHALRVLGPHLGDDPDMVFEELVTP